MKEVFDEVVNILRKSVKFLLGVLFGSGAGSIVYAVINYWLYIQLGKLNTTNMMTVATNNLPGWFTKYIFVTDYDKIMFNVASYVIIGLIAMGISGYYGIIKPMIDEEQAKAKEN